MLSANPFKKSRTSHFFPSSRFYRLLDLSTCPSRVSIACCILSKVWDQVWDDHQIGLEGRRALVEMSPTELLSQNPNASNIFAPTLGKISKKLSSMKLHKHGKSMVSARQAVLSRRNGPSFRTRITRMMTSSPSRVHAARKRGFYLWMLVKSKMDD